MSDTAVHAKGSVLLVDEFDISNMLSSAKQSFDKEYVDTTVFGLGDKEGISGHRGSVLSMEGFRKGTRQAYADLIEDIIEDADVNHLCSYSGEGMGFGKQVWMIDSIENSAQVTGANSGAVMLSLAFLADGGARLGVVLSTHRGTSGITQNTEFRVNLASATGPGIVNFKASSLGAGGDVTITPGALASQIKTYIESLAAYGTVTVTGNSPYVGNQGTVAGALSSSDFAGTPKGNAFDGVSATLWQSNTVAPAWIGNDFGTGRVIASYRVYFDQLAVQQARDWTIEGANDAAFTSGVTVLHTVTNNVITASGFVTFPCTVMTTKRYVRMNISAVNAGSNPTMRELEFRLADPTSSTGNYTIGVVDPAAEDIQAPTTSSTGYSAVKTRAGGTLGELTLRSAAFNGTSIDNLAATTTGGTFFLHAIYASAGTKSLIVEIQDSADNVGWTTIDTFATLTDVGQQKRTITGTIRRYMRMRVNTGGITGTWAFMVGASRFR